MNILVSGYHNPQFATITEYIERAVVSLGHALSVFDDRQHIIPGRIRRRIPWLHRYDLDHINKQLILLAGKSKPAVVIVTGGDRISADTVAVLNQMNIDTVLWTTDYPFHDPQRLEKVAPLYNHVFCQGTDGVDFLRGIGVEKACWLPMGCDPACHYPVQLSEPEEARYSHDVVFVGSYYPKRAELLNRLSNLDLAIWGPGWQEGSHPSLKNRIKGAHTTVSEWQKIYSSSRVVLAIGDQRQEICQISPRIFEALACGAFVIAENQKDTRTVFNDGEHLVFFSDFDDLSSKLDFYLRHPLERDDIAKKGMTEVVQHHTYSHRIASLLSSITSKP